MSYQYYAIYDKNSTLIQFKTKYFILNFNKKKKNNKHTHYNSK